MGILVGVAVAVALWLVLEFKTSRPDGMLATVHPYRKLMLFLMPTRAESVVYFDSYVDVEELDRYLEAARVRFNANMTHCVVAACAIGLGAVPRMNRFVVGRRLYERKVRSITFAMKREKLDRKAKLATVKLEVPDGETFASFCQRVNETIGNERSGKRTSADKEFDLLSAMPRPLLGLLIRLSRVLDYYNLLPGFFIRQDPLFTSVFVANLGSLDMGAPYHHLFEYGSCSLFVGVGKVEEMAVVVDGVIKVKRLLRLRYTYDDRIDDGLNARFGIDAVKRVLEQPFRFLGCVAHDATDVKAMWPRKDWEHESVA